MTKSVVHTDNAPKAIGPYSQAVTLGNLVFCSGQIPLDPASMQITGADISAQTAQVLKNLDAVLKAAGAARDCVLKTTVFLKNFNDFQAMNSVYEEFFGTHKPARSTVEVARLPRDVLVEIECIAHKP
ncbi:MAG: RidA family protein [Proteobacteria bacterium]|nr:RidA family protein [Pseudomonadota bacterium]